MNILSSESLHRYLTEPANYRTCLLSLLDSAPEQSVALAFAHVLNVPISEEIWPGDAIMLNLLPSAFFAKSPYTGEFVHSGLVGEHMRCEILRLCSGESSALDHMKDELDFYYEFDGPFPSEFGDSSDDEVEPFYYPEDF